MEASDVKPMWANIVRTLPYTAYTSCFVYSVIFESQPAAALTAGLILNEAVNHLEKALLKALFPDSAILKRPAGAMDTAIFPAHKPKISTTQGMPSGHSQTAWFLATVLADNIFREYQQRSAMGDAGSGALVSCVARSLFVWGGAVLVSASRTSHGGRFCVSVDGVMRPPHTVLQVVVGGVIGVLFAAIALSWYHSS